MTYTTLENSYIDQERVSNHKKPIAERWYTTPGGTSPYELNTHISSPQGLAWGPKSKINTTAIIFTVFVIVMIGAVFAVVTYRPTPEH